MSVYSSIVKGLNEAIEYERGSLKNVKRHVMEVKPLPNYNAKEIKGIRLNLELSQKVFANVMGVSEKTVEAWEAGRNIPQGPARRILEIFNNDSTIITRFIK